MFTGRWPHELSADWFRTLDEKYPTLAESLRAQGYNTAAFVANTYYCSYEQGLGRGFIHYEDYVISPAEILMSSSLVRTIVNDTAVRRALGYYDVATQKNASDVNRDFLAWITRNDQRPFFAFLNYFDAHELYLPPAPFDVKFGENIARENYDITFVPRRALLRNRFAMSPQETEAEMNAYDGAIAYLDDELGLLLDELERRRVLDNTIVLVTADHGEQFGEHRLNVHGNSLYLQLLHVPLLIVSPSRLPGGIRIKQPVTLRDLPATVLDLVRVRDWDARFPGDSLARFWKDTDKDANSAEDMLLSEVSGPGFGEQWYPTFKGDLKSLVVGHHHYIRNGDGREELYNFEDDPQEKRDLANSIGGAQILERCRATFEQTIVRNRPPD
jgi:arylsulfatase A-like enzyme